MRRRALLLVGLAVAVASSTHAQTFGGCEPGRAQRFLENEQLRISLFNTGALFFGGSTTSGDGYLIPKDTGNSPMFAAGLWLGGRVDGEVRVAAARYGSWDFWPGPLESAASPPVACFPYDRIYVVSREDVRRYYATGELTDDLRDWPHRLGAPVIDGDGDSTNYDLEAGDQPDLIGDVAAWWVMNDAGGDHGISGPTGPLGVEVRAHAFLYGGAATIISPVLSQTTFIRYEVINRGRQSIEQMYASIWADPDLGDPGDDYIGTDTLRSMVFVYNDSNQDAGYGVAPPAQGVQILEGPIGLANGLDDDRDGEVDEPDEALRATATTSFLGYPRAAGPPSELDGFYNYMQGFWGDGSVVREYGGGYRQDNGRVTTFALAGDPVTESFWSEVNLDGHGTNQGAGDRGMILSTGPFRLRPDSSAKLMYAMPFGWGSDNLNSIAVMRGFSTALQQLHSDGFFTSHPVENTRPRSAFELALLGPHPNPSRQPEAVLALPEAAHVRATVYDALGRQLKVLIDGELAEGETTLAMPVGLAPGTYLLRVEVPGAVETLTFTVVR